MKRTLTLSAAALAVACALAAHYVRAQDPQQADAAGQQYRKSEQNLVDAILEWASENPKGAPDQALRRRLRSLVEGSFEARQRLQQAELDELRRRLAEIEEAIQERQEHKSVVINSRLNNLINAIGQNNMEALQQMLKDGIAGRTGDRPTPDRFTSNSPRPASIYPPTPPTPGADSTSENSPAPRVVPLWGPMVPVAPPLKSKDEGSQEAKAPTPPEAAFDIETRERLARLDLQAAEETYVAAEKALTQARQRPGLGAITEGELSALEKDRRDAAIEVERAKIKLDGIARQRAELETAAEADVAEAQAEVDKAEANIQIARGRLEGVEAQFHQWRAGVLAAKAAYALSETEYERFKKLADQKAIDLHLLEEAQEKRVAANAALEGAQATVQKGEANIQQAKAEVLHAQAELGIAEQRLEAAKARRDRLTKPRSNPTNQQSSSEAPPGGGKQNTPSKEEMRALAEAHRRYESLRDQQYQLLKQFEKLIGRWRVDWKLTAELGGKSAEEAKLARDQSITEVTWNFSKDGTLRFKHVRNMKASEFSGGTWKPTNWNSEQNQLELQVTKQGRTYDLTVEFLSADQIKLTGPVLDAVLTRVQGPVVQVLTMHPGMSTESVEKQITNRVERWVNQAPGAERTESKSAPGASLVNIYFRGDVDPNTAVSTINSLALAVLPNLPADTLPPVVLPCDDAGPKEISEIQKLLANPDAPPSR